MTYFLTERRWTSCRKEKAEHSMPRFGIPAPADFPVMPSRKWKMPQLGVVRSMIMNTRFFLCDGSAHTVISFVPLKMSRFLNFEPCGEIKKITCLIWIDWVNGHCLRNQKSGIIIAALPPKQKDQIVRLHFRLPLAPLPPQKFLSVGQFFR